MQPVLPLETALDQGATIITATRRLSRELVNLYDRRRVAAGDTAWPSADILPLEAWLKRSWDALQPVIESPRLLLSEEQSLSLWHGIIKQDVAHNDRESAPLWNHFATAREAQKAWRTVIDWALGERLLPNSRHADHRAFARWSRAFTARCEERNWLDGARLTTAIIENVHALPADPLCLVGFDHMTPIVKSLVDVLRHHRAEAGATISVLEPAEKTFQDTPVSHWSDEFRQWLAAGEWARRLLETDPNKRLAIVVPDLDRSRALVEYAMRQSLCGADLMHPADPASLPFHLSLGRPLIDFEAGREALALLEAVTAGFLLPDQVVRLFQSPWLGGYEREIEARSLLLREVRRRREYRISLVELQTRVADATSCPLLADQLYGVCDLLRELPPKAPFSIWSNYIGDLLTRLGWPGSHALRSDQFQTVEAIRAQVGALAEVDLVSEPGDLRNAMRHLGQRLSGQIFQPESHDAPVQVLGIVESTGLQFDAVWVGNLVEELWPGGVTPNPFLPVNVQQDAGIPGASHSALQAQARTQVRRLAGATPVLAFSTFAREGEVALAPSPIIRGCPVVQTDPTPLTLAEKLQQSQPSLTHLNDDNGPTVRDTAQLRGGTSLIRAQSYCPRGAYLRFRLGGERVMPASMGLDPAERGTLIHTLLDRLWTAIGSSFQLSRLSDTDLEARIVAEARNASRYYFRSSGCGKRFFELQLQWLIQTLLSWFQIERRRAHPFKVLAREEKASLDLAGLPLAFQIDRIDQFEDGTLGLIDYKTGGNLSIAEWGEQRPNEPQLPLYWMSQQTDSTADQPGVSVVAFARVRLGDCRLLGVTSQPDMVCNDGTLQLSMPENHRILGKLFADWDALTAHWRASLTALAEEFNAGSAVIDPRNHGVCRGCPTPAFCRSGDGREDVYQGLASDRRGSKTPGT